MNYSTETYKNYRITVDYDEYCESPRDWDNIATMVSWHRDLILGDIKHQYSNGKLIQKIDWNIPMRSYNSKDEILVKCIYPESRLYQEPDWDEVDSYEDVQVPDDLYVNPLYIYDHSGITINMDGFSCPWDSGQYGWIFVTKDKMDAEGLTEEYCQEIFHMTQRKYAQELMRNEVDTFDAYLTGQVFGYTVERLDEHGEVVEEVTSCSGYYGYEDMQTFMMKEARAEVDRDIERRFKKYGEVLKLDFPAAV